MSLGDPKRKGKIQSINFGEEEYAILTDAVKRTGTNYSALVNLLISEVLGADDEVRQDLAIYAYQKALEHAAEASKTTGYYRKPLLNRSGQYMRLVNLLTFGEGVVTSPENGNTQRIDLKDSYLLCPVDWVWLDVCDATDSSKAIVIEFYNADKFNLPHFVFALDGDLTDDIEEEALEAAAEKSKEYDKLRLMYQDPRFSKEGRLLNAKEMHEQPVPGFFEIPKLGTEDSYPYGAMIIERSE